MNIPPPPPSTPTPFFSFHFFFFFFTWRSARGSQFLFTLSFSALSSLGGDSASCRDSLMWTSVPWRVACELVSLMSSHVMLGLCWLCWLKGLCVFSCSLPPALHFRHTDRGLLCAAAITRGWNGYRHKSESWLRRGTFSHRSCRDSNPQPSCQYLHTRGAFPALNMSSKECSLVRSLFTSYDQQT